ncbi:MAG TPA: FAD-dependent oxidoreductase [Pirellulales bacterium]|nr:FAD-dependent oxidoreductase [Pirellulales bacterium]
MPLRVSNVRLSIDEPEQALPERLAQAIDVRPDEIVRWRILRKSLDTRDKSNLHFVYTAEVVAPEAEATVDLRSAARTGPVQIEPYEEPPFELPSAGDKPLDARPIVVGSGPAGLVAAYFLAAGGYRPLVLERGRAVRERIRDVHAFDSGGPLDTESNYLFGEGGAGTFSDGKLTCRSSGPDVRRVLELFAECKGKPSILYDYRPHLGSNRLPAVVKALRQRIEGLGGEFRFSCRVEDLDQAEGRIRGLATSSGHLPADVVVLAIGHSARDTYEMLLARGVPMEPKPFQIGVRIEQPQEQVNRAQYGPARVEEKLGAADYSLVARGRVNLFSFCMCAGGQVIPSVSEPGHFSTNGMSLSRRESPFANSGLMVTLEPHEFGSRHVLAGMFLQRRYEARAYAIGGERYACPIQSAHDFLARRRSGGKLASSYTRELAAVELDEFVPPQAVAALRQGLPLLDRRWRGLFLANATLVGPEARGSSPVRFPRDSRTLESVGVGGLYPIGEGAGYAGGIVSAALDGLRAAKAIIARYAPLERT